MADGTVTDAAPARLSDWVRIGILYLAARAVTTVFLFVAAGLSQQGSRFGPHATIADFVLGWDAQWYWYVAVNGYPATLPLTATGQVAENQWAFLPIYPYLAAGLGAVLGHWGLGALVVSLVAGYLAALVLYRMLRERQDRATATWAVVFFVAGPMAALFQLGYAEALFLLWLFLALWCVLRRRYRWLFLFVPLMAYTRPGVLPFALFLGLYVVWRWLRRRSDPFGARELLTLAGAGAVAVVTGFSWQFIAAAVTGRPDAYLATELAWRRNWIPDAPDLFRPFDGFVQGVGFWFGHAWGMSETIGYVVLAASVVGVAALLLFEPHVRRLGVELRLWAASYLVYLLAVFFPQSSIFRLLVPLSPLWGAVAMPRSRVWRGAVLAACLAGQWWWIYSMYALGKTFSQIP